MPDTDEFAGRFSPDDGIEAAPAHLTSSLTADGDVLELIGGVLFGAFLLGGGPVLAVLAARLWGAA